MIPNRHVRYVRSYLSGCPGNIERTALILGFMVLVAARLPNVTLHGRVWAEEGAVFLRNAMVLPWTRAIVYSVGGYLNVVANLAGMVAADIVPLEQVRWVGVTTGFVFQTIPAILIVSSRWDWLQNRIGLALALLLLATMPIAEEVWLNSLHPQFHLTLCVALILGMDPARGWRGGFYLTLILLAALCGPTAWFLLPLFAARSWLDRSRPRLVQTAILAAGVLLQATFFYEPSQTNGSSFNLSAFVSVLAIKNLLIPLLDHRSAGAIAGGLMQMAEAGTVPVTIAVAESLLICLLGGLLWFRGRRAWFWMFMSGIAIALPSYAAARGGMVNFMHIGSGNRYAFVPQVMFVLILLGVALTARGGAGRIASFGILWLLMVGVSEFHDDSVHGYFDQGPPWVDEVAAWRRDPTHVIRIWPDVWTFDVNAREPVNH
jgi:hypothetical protein